MNHFRPEWTEVVNEQITECLDKVTDMNVLQDEVTLDKPESGKPEASEQKEGTKEGKKRDAEGAEGVLKG